MRNLRELYRYVCVTAALLAVGAILAGCDLKLSQISNPLIKIEPTRTSTALPPTDLPSPQPAQRSSTGSVLGDQAQIIIAYDNYPFQAELGQAWGFSAYITLNGERILFDSGGSGSLLLSNLEALNISPEQIETVVLSHEHEDHTGGLQSLLNAGTEPILYIPPSFSSGFKNRFRNQTELIEVSPGMELAEGIYSLGEMSGPPPEQGIVLDTDLGLVIITGCAHPGVDLMVREAVNQFKKEIYLVLGGFHLGNESDGTVNQIIAELQNLGVKYAAPCHCTGDHAISLFRNAFGEYFIQVGVGAVISLEG